MWEGGTKRQQAFLQSSAGVSKCGSHRSAKTKCKSRPRARQNRPRGGRDPRKSISRPSEIESRGFPNPVRSLPKCGKPSPCSLRTISGQSSDRLRTPTCATWLQLGGPRGSKTRPKPEKIDVEKQHQFSIDFLMVQTSFWKGFW